MQKPIILYTVIIAALLVLGFLFLWLPEYRELRGVLMRLEAKKEELQNKEKYFGELASISEKLKEFSSELAKIESALPSTQNIPGDFNFISAAASRNGLILQRTEVGKAFPFQEDSPVLRTELLFSVAGPYDGFRNFVSELQTSSRLIAFEEIFFKEPDSAGIFSFNLRISTYSY